jgi:hypothetical protein
MQRIVSSSGTSYPQAIEKSIASFLTIISIIYRVILFRYYSYKALDMSVDWRSRHFAFRGRAGEPPRRFAPAGSPLPRTPAGVFVPSAPINECF